VNKKTIYDRFAKFYDLDVSNSNFKDVPLYIHLLEKYDVKTIIELCCGSGRVTIPLAMKGFFVIGVDISSEMLKLFRIKLKNFKIDLTRLIQLVNKDMTKYKSAKKVDSVIIPFHSFQCLTSYESIGNCIQSIKRNLKDNGILILSMSNPSIGLSSFEKAREVKYFQTSDENEMIERILSNERINKIENILEYSVEYKYYINSILVDKTKVHISSKIYFPNELIKLLEDHNFVLVECLYGYINPSVTNNLNDYTIVCKMLNN
jgi:SAM-dependent methyltransferase